MAEKRYITFLLPAVAIGAQSGPTAIASFDDNAPRHLTGFMCSNVTKLTRIIFDLAGRVFATVDCGATAPTAGVYPLDVKFPPGVLFSVNVQVMAGGTAVTANTDELVLQYEGPDLVSGA